MDLSVISSSLPTDCSYIIDNWLLDIEVSENTAMAYSKGVIKYIEFLSSNNLKTSKETIISFKNKLMKEYSNSTAYIYMSGIKNFYKYLSKTYGILDVANEVKLPKISKGFKRDCLAIDQLSLLFNLLNENNIVNLRDKVMINLFVRCGLRTCELKNINVEDISTINGQKILYIKGKGHIEKDEYVILTDFMMNLINKYLLQRKNYIDKSPLFISHSNRTSGKRLDNSTIRFICKKYLKQVNNSPKISTHSFRHTAITISILAGSNLIDIKDFARHSSVNTTLKYVHNLKRIENAPELKIDEFLNDSI